MVQKTRKGFVWIVGAGLGDPELLTLKAVKVLKQADVVLHDRLIHQSRLKSWAPSAKLINVGKKASFHTLPQDQIEQKLIQLANRGLTVVRLKGGDPFIFGRGAEECEALVKANIAFEVIPGISSALAAPLYAGVPLTHRDYASGFAVVTGHENPIKGQIPYKSGKERRASSWVDWPALSKMGTIVFLMSMGNLRANMERLQHEGKPGDTPALAVRWASLGKQKVIRGTISTIADDVQKAGLKAPAVIVVGGVVSLSEKISWVTNKTLQGQKVLITRSSDGNLALASLLEEKGAFTIPVETFQIKTKPLTDKLKKEFKMILKSDWLIFTSTSGVESFSNLYGRIFKDVRPLSQVKMAAVGVKTEKALLEAGFWCDLKSKIPSAKGVAKEKVFQKLKNQNIVLVQGTDARDDFLKIHGERHKVKALVVYSKISKSLPDEMSKKLVKSVPHWCVFLSPSALKPFEKKWGQKKLASFLEKTKVACFSGATQEVLLELGVKPNFVCRSAKIENLIKGLAA